MWISFADTHNAKFYDIAIAGVMEVGICIVALISLLNCTIWIIRDIFLFSCESSVPALSLCRVFHYRLINDESHVFSLVTAAQGFSSTKI